MLRSILYVSNCAVGFAQGHKRVSDIVDQSRPWNASVGITGALVFTERHFVQLIEGPGDAIKALVAKLRVDRRHSNMAIIQDSNTAQRHFDGWSLAYCGPDTFIDEHLLAQLQNQSMTARRTVIAHLTSLLISMAKRA